MHKVAPDPKVLLSPSQIPETDALPPKPPQELPKHLADFKQYVDSKFCYFSGPAAQAKMLGVQLKVAYQCQMKTLIEERKIVWTEKAHPWTNDTFLRSSTIDRLVESTVRCREGMGDMWEDYVFSLPSTDKKTRHSRKLPEGNYLTRCFTCHGKGFEKCTNSDCDGSGSLKSGTGKCSTCKGTGKERCLPCKSLGGLLHSPTLIAKWFTRQSKWYCQNSYLPEKEIRKGKRNLFWSTRIEPGSQDSSIQNIVDSIVEQTPGIELNTIIMKHYHEKHLNPIKSKKSRIRRLECVIERMDFEEIEYTMGENYVNKKDPTQGTKFRFCQYPGPKGQPVIYENDYPLNNCGCFGEKVACYSFCCNIL